MIRSLSDNPTMLGAFSATVAVFCFSINDMAIKFMSRDYALHQVVLLRALDLVALLGIALIAGSGLFMVWREAQLRKAAVPGTPRYRR